MRKDLVIGIIRETKAWERRAPLTPADVKWLVKRGVHVEVESSTSRVFSDQDYKKHGARILDKFKNANFLLGIKEPRIDDLYENKVYMLFSHTSKGQLNNIPLLKACLRNKITLIDYEKMIDKHGRRLVYFGRFAGICGLVDCLHYLGGKLEGRGIDNPFTVLKPAHEYGSLRAVKKAMVKVEHKIRRQGFPRRLTPFIIGITGHGNVAKGVHEVLDLLDPVEIHPRDMLKFVRHQKAMCHKVYKIAFIREERFRSNTGAGFYYEDYLKHPDKFESNLDSYLPYLNLLIHTSYWDKRYPILVTKKMIHKLARRKPFRLEFIGDVSCDIDGSIELTYRTTTPADPTFTYDVKKHKYVDGYKTDGITILAVDNLPAELPKDASAEFSRLIRDYVYQIAVHGVKDITNHIALPLEIRRAVITQNNKLTQKYRYLNKSIRAFKDEQIP